MENAIKTLYQDVFPSVAQYVSRRGGTLDEAKDVFHDALVVYYEKKTEGLLVTFRGDQAYLFGVARHLWAKRYAENQRYASLDQLMATFEGRDAYVNGADDDSIDEAVSNQRILQLLRTAGKKCMEILTGFYYEKADMGVLARRFGFASIRSATVQKFKCLQKVKQVVKEKSLQYEDFLN